MANYYSISLEFDTRTFDGTMLVVRLAPYFPCYVQYLHIYATNCLARHHDARVLYVQGHMCRLF